MSEAEKIESQKTVVAFISGLLIGGLLVWVFSTSPEVVVAPEDTETAETTEVEDAETNEEISTNTTEVERETVIGEGSITINDQSAGDTVVVASLILPTNDGWVVVRDYVEGNAGNILGAARYSVEEGLFPTSIDLVRGTVSGGTYQAVFFTNGGEKKFDLNDDVQIDGIETVFETE